ncbi:hypothetical protein F4861DRAFT_420643 [Xylaria intraflava]|nr:hypothetical protein F4861DRAFT_420643 [Xylaria intraflava]
MCAKPEANVELELELSTNTLSLSELDQALSIKVTATTLSSSKPSSGICFNARWTVMDDRLIAYRYPFRLRSVSKPDSFIRLSPAIKISSSRPPEEPDLRRNELERFLVVPGVGKGGLGVEHKLTVGRIFEYSELKPSDVKPGSEYQFEVHDWSLPPQWWTFEDEAEGKRFLERELPDDDESDGFKSDDNGEMDRLYREGWLYSYPITDCIFTVKSEPRAVIRFTK